MAIGTYRAGCSHCSNVLWEYMHASWAGVTKGHGTKRHVARRTRVSKHFWAGEICVHAEAQYALCDIMFLP